MVAAGKSAPLYGAQTRVEACPHRSVALERLGVRKGSGLLPIASNAVEVMQQQRMPREKRKRLCVPSIDHGYTPWVSR